MALSTAATFAMVQTVSALQYTTAPTSIFRSESDLMPNKMMQAFHWTIVALSAVYSAVVTVALSRECDDQSKKTTAAADTGGAIQHRRWQHGVPPPTYTWFERSRLRSGDSGVKTAWRWPPRSPIQ